MRRPAETVSEEEAMNQEGSLAVSPNYIYFMSYLMYSSRSADPIPMTVFVVVIQIQPFPAFSPTE